MPNFWDSVTWSGSSSLSATPTTNSTTTVSPHAWAPEVSPEPHEPQETQPLQTFTVTNEYGESMPEQSTAMPHFSLTPPHPAELPVNWEVSSYAGKIVNAYNEHNYLTDHLYYFIKRILTVGADSAGPELYGRYHVELGWSAAKFSEYFEKAREIIGDREEVKSKPPLLDCTFKQAFPHLRLKTVRGEIGLEIEAEGKNLFKSPIQYWGAVADGSLRAVDGHPPLEYVLRQPISREEVLPALEYLSDRLKSAKSELKMSHRCSVHVHLNIQSMKIIDLMKFMTLYFIFEDMLVGWSGPERKGNLFCLRAKDACYQIELLTNALRNNDFGGVFNQEMRYSAMNIASMGVHGSLEFRSMRGTVDIGTIKDWVDILTVLKDVSSSFKNPESISRMFQSLGPDAFMNRVFLGRISSSLLTAVKAGGSVNPHQSMWDCFRVVRDLAHAIDWESPPEYMKEVKGSKTKKVSVDEEEPDEEF